MQEKRVTKARARHMLGAFALKLTDDQVEELLDSMYLLADENLMYNSSKESEMSNDTTIPDTET